jgi:hypothetical protein
MHDGTEEARRDRMRDLNTETQEGNLEFKNDNDDIGIDQAD